MRRVEINHIGFDGKTHRGDLIVHEDLAAEVIAIFEELRQLRYPIEKIRTVDTYPAADDELSMEDNNTSAFNGREIPGTGRWSQHAFGRAIDINPLLNPYIDRTGAFEPRNAAPYLDRNRIDPGLLHAGDPAVRVFTDRGWRWGGYWRTPPTIRASSDDRRHTTLEIESVHTGRRPSITAMLGRRIPVFEGR